MGNFRRVPGFCVKCACLSIFAPLCKCYHEGTNDKTAEHGKILITNRTLKGAHGTMTVTEKLAHAAERKAFETMLDSLIRKSRTQDVGKVADDLVRPRWKSRTGFPFS